MSRSTEDKIPEIQSSFVAAFLKQKLGKDALVSTNFRKEYSKCLSLFLFYLSTIAKHNLGDSKKKLTKACILKALSDVGFEDFAEQLGELQIDFKQQTNQKQQQTKKPVQAPNAHASLDDAQGVADRMDEDLQNMNIHADIEGARRNNDNPSIELEDDEDEEENVASDDEDLDENNKKNANELDNEQGTTLEAEAEFTEASGNIQPLNNNARIASTMDQIIGSTQSKPTTLKPYEELF